MLSVAQFPCYHDPHMNYQATMRAAFCLIQTPMETLVLLVMKAYCLGPHEMLI